jgi:hypothetical protein
VQPGRDQAAPASLFAGAEELFVPVEEVELLDDASLEEPDEPVELAVEDFESERLSVR